MYFCFPALYNSWEIPMDPERLFILLRPYLEEMVHTSSSTFSALLRSCEYLHSTAMIGSSNALFTSQRQKALLREYASLQKQRSHEAPAILVQLSKIALETVVRLLEFEYHTVVMIPLLQHMSNVYDIPVHDFKDFPTSCLATLLCRMFKLQPNRKKKNFER